MSHAIMIFLPCFLFELSPFNELFKGKTYQCLLHNFHTLSDILIIYSIILGQDSVSHVKIVALPCFLFELSPLMQKQCVFNNQMI